MSDTKVLDKIKKMIATAENEAATDNERETAMRMVHKLLAKHNLSLLDVDNHNKDEERVQLRELNYSFPWSRSITDSLARLYFCKIYLGHKHNSQKINYYFIGKESNVVTASLMSQFINKSILKECTRRFKQNLNPESRSFALGAASVIRQRVDEIIAQKDDEGRASESTAVAIRNIYENEDSLNDEFIEASGVSLVTKKPRSLTAPIHGKEFDAGMEFGGKVSLNNQVEGKKSKRITNG